MGRSNICGFGINDADYAVIKVDVVDGKKRTVWKCPYYSKWIGMIKRCYSINELKRKPSYKDCYVCEEWKYFMAFRSWMIEQDWEGKQLDKDLLVYQNKVYSPDTCIFIEQKLNKFMTKSNKIRGEYPIGVNFRKRPKDMINDFTNPYFVQMGRDETGKRNYVGVFPTPEEAHRAWQLAKVERAKKLQTEQTNQRVIAGLQRIIDKIQYDYANNLETIDF